MKKAVVLFAMVFSFLKAGAQTLPLEPNGPVYSILQSNGMTYLGGDFTKIARHTGGAALFTVPSSLPVQSFPQIDGKVYTSAPDGQGGWFIGGEFTKVGGRDRKNLAHIKADNSVDTNWNPSADLTVWSMALWQQVLYIGGDFQNVNGVFRLRAAAISWDGTLTSWAPMVDGRIKCMVAYGNIVYLGGYFSQVGGQQRWNAGAVSLSGQVTPWNPWPNREVWAIAVADNGKIFLGGDFTIVGGRTRNYAAAVTNNGALDSWNPNMNSRVSAFCIVNDIVYAGGNFTTVGTVSRSFMAALRMDGTLLPWNQPQLSGQVNSIVKVSDALYVGGLFRINTSNGAFKAYNGAFSLSTGTLISFDAGINGSVWTMSASGGKLLMGGEFTSAGSVERSKFAEINGRGELTSLKLPVNGTVYALTTIGSLGDAICLGGQFTLSYNGQQRSHVAAVDRWSNELTSFKPAVNGGITALASDASNVYLAGMFSQINGVQRSYCGAVSNTNTVTSWAAHANYPVYSIARSGDTVYVGGAFTTINNSSRQRLAALKTNGLLIPNWTPSANATVHALSVSNGIVYAGGEFTSVNNTIRKRLAAITRLNQLMSWNPGANDTVRALKAFSNVIYAGGSFTNIAGQQQGFAAAITAQGTLVSWNPKVNAPVRALSASGLGVTLGGRFTKVATSDTRYFAVLRAPFVISPIDFFPRENARDDDAEAFKTENAPEISIGRTFPNPSNGSFSVEFSIATAEPVEMSIVNTLGQEVYSFHNVFEAGSHTLPVNIESATNGTYFVRLKTGHAFTMFPVQIIK
ncbi:MAG: T9SS type A sorting domain-containing protein [Bacteroidota bacterium]